MTVNPATGEVKDFASGWLCDEVVTGRPVDLEVAPDKALMFSDSGANPIYRITCSK